MTFFLQKKIDDSQKFASIIIGFGILAPYLNKAKGPKRLPRHNLMSVLPQYFCDLSDNLQYM